jgi:hypothetical protein
LVEVVVGSVVVGFVFIVGAEAEAIADGEGVGS